MKKWIVLLLVLTVSCFAFVACGHEHEFSAEWRYDETHHWREAVCEHTDMLKDLGRHTFADGKCTECGAPETSEFRLTLDAGEGGTIDGSGRIKVVETAVGQSVAELVGGVKITAKDGFTFEGWYIGDEKVSTQAVEGETVVTAKYTVACEVKVYLQAEDGSYGEPQVVSTSGIYGEHFQYAATEEHYTLDETRYSRLATDALMSGDEFVVWLRREKYEVTYHTFDGDGTERTAVAPDAMYGTLLKVGENPFGVEDGRRFAGWATEQDGQLDAKYAPGADAYIEGKLDLYAVWDDAYADRAGGGDYIFLPQSQSGTAILDRAGVEFTGKVSGNVFTIEYEGTTLRGKINESNHTFMYADSIEKGVYVYYDRYYNEDETADRTEEDVTLTLDEYGEGTLKIGEESYEGVCFYDPMMGDYIFAIDEETAAYFTVGKSANEKYFTLQGEEYGSYAEFVSATGFLQGYAGDGLLTLNGYGEAVYYHTYYREYYEGYYSIDAQNSYSDGTISVYCVKLHLFDHDGWIFGERSSTYGEWVDRTAYCLNIGGTIIYVYEDTDAKGEFTSEYGTLTLDGYGGYASSAVLNEGAQTISGGYYAYTSEIFGTIVELSQTNGPDLCFIIDTNAGTYTQLDGKITEMVSLHTDYYGRSEFGEPVLVMYAEDNGKIPADVYLEINGDMTCVEKGYCTATEQAGYTVYTFKSESVLDAEHKPFDSIVFIADELMDNNEILVRAYYVFVTDGVNDYKVFTGTGNNAGETIWFASLGYDGVGAFYKTKDGRLLEGSFRYSSSNEWFDGDDEYGVFRYVGEDDTWAFVYFEIDGGDDNGDHKTFTETPFLPYRLTSTDDTYNYWYENLCIDANGKAQFMAQDEFENDLGVVNGIYTATGKTICGYDVYKFEPQSNDWDIVSFEFVIEDDYIYSYSHGIALTQAVYHEKDTQGKYEFEIEGGGTLKGDGFWFKGKYEGPFGSYEGLMYNGRYDERGKVIIFDAGEFAVVFDITEDGKLSMRDGTDGYYKLLDDNSQNVNKWSLELDGHGGLRVFDDSVYDYVYDGVYAETEEYGIYRITIYMGNSMTLEWDVALISASSNVAVIVNKDCMGMYVASDMSIINIDGLNTGSYYIDPEGVGHMGDYYLFDEFGAFNYADGSEVITFTYDKDKKTFERLDMSAYYGAYYSNDYHSSYIFDKTVSADDNAGYYMVNGENVIMYLLSEYSSDITKKRGTLKDGVLTVDGSKYVSFSDKITLKGTATLNGETQLSDLTLEFTPVGKVTDKTDVTLNGKGNMQIAMSGRYLWLYVDGNMLELDIDIESGTFVIVCEYDGEMLSLKSALGID